ncbi:MAG: hypothetical protein NC048_08390 [Bacteroides sp.]|nr:hypothetical protein [Ruminococcus flavefaciens]MCM1555051.1 hypothetical protein [Bacteroides sp.]MCM1555498.1 hypothetical protein [Bacteroides sp.]
MKKVRIGLLLVSLVGTGVWLSATESLVLDNEQPVLTPKAAQADTIRMTWKVENTSSSKEFSFRGEEGATYKVEWGDGETDTYQRAGYRVDCYHKYSTPGTYTVLLYGISK